MWNGSVDLSQFSAELENVRIQNDGPIRAAMRGRLLSIQSFRLVGEGTDISATGTAQLLEPWRVSLRADGHINMKILQSLNPDYMSYGMVTVAMRVGGTIGSPDFEGELQIAHGGISYIDLPSGLSEINGTLTFNRDRLSVRSLTAKTGGGNLDLGGYITYGRKINFDLTARGHEVRLRYPPGVSSTANLDLHLAGSLASSVLAGDILITRFGLNPNFDFAVYLARAKQATPLTPANSPLSNLKLDVHVTSTPELQVQTSSAKLSGDVDLRLRGTGTHPAVLGRVNITQGQVSFNGTKYELERGDITFTNPVSIEPVFDLEAMARVRDYDITLGFHGPIDKLSTTYSSDPPLPTADIIALLAVGRTREESAMLQSQTTENFVQSTSNAILGQALNQAVSNRLERLFGVSRIKIDPEAGGAENNTSGTRVTVEQQVSNNVTLTYITNVSQAQQQIIQAEYYITKNLSIIAVRDQNGVLGVDVRIRRRKK
jgi:translocation and assembly module TamB